MFDLIRYITSKPLEDHTLESIQIAIDELQNNLQRAFDIRDALGEEDYDPTKFEV